MIRDCCLLGLFGGVKSELRELGDGWDLLLSIKIELLNTWDVKAARVGYDAVLTRV